MKDCIFCKIAARDIPSEIVFEDSEHVAFLDINPMTEGMTVVIPKKHYSSDMYSNSQEVISSIMEAAKKTANLLSEKIGCERVLTSIQGLEIAHLHVKLYPYFSQKSVYDTLTGNNFKKPSAEELKVLADNIRS